MDALRRFSSRWRRLDHAFLNDRLRGARAYRRIAGYFRSSIFELVGEEIAQMRRQAKDAFEIRYERRVDPDRDRWELCSRVLARRDIVERMSTPWRT